MTEPHEPDAPEAAPEIPLHEIRLDHTTVEDEDELDIVAQELALYLRRGEFGSVKGFFVVQEIADIASLFEHMEPEDALLAMRQLDREDQAEVFGYLKPSAQVVMAEKMSREELARLMAAMSHDDRVDFYKALDPKAQEALLPGLAKAEREDLRRLASYEEGTVGAIMTSDYATLPPTLTAPQALDALRRQASDVETVYTAYVVDPRHRLLGVVSLRDILLARSRQTVRETMEADPVVAQVDAGQEEAAALIARYDLLALPVVDGDGRMVGIVTADDAMDVAEEEATEDIYKSSNVGEFEGSVKDASLFSLYRARIVWLVLLVFGNIFSGAGISLFEDTIAGNLALLFFLPLLIGSGGNAGAQSATLMVRALATGDVRASDWGGLVGRELAIGLALGLTMSVAVSAVGLVRAGVDVTMVVALAMTLIVVVGALIGVSLPFVLSRFDLDPATASGPLVTSIADVTGVLIYFGIARALLPD
ncbi:magnesium transporter [Amaricoccus sp.]|uniref:magnesium transporter n=1 Tax=Amaricoccus sp. TaxID=1872485 RepID=UPI001B60521D|nr:magnesium transporter [Amaricoccus sp.]MBP7003152.1 magnesium transporter [Amaricoccus sp.]